MMSVLWGASVVWGVREAIVGQFQGEAVSEVLERGEQAMVWLLGSACEAKCPLADTSEGC